MNNLWVIGNKLVQNIFSKLWCVNRAARTSARIVSITIVLLYYWLWTGITFDEYDNIVADNIHARKPIKYT